ncbi:hypothetical protein [Oryzifoliimicrobium ureilyticus]|uniref:hypothetical protein n=1 Tax=Oryzifoliimicrobium ureilyticus TaxID=3113724 RepID=UPI0030766615
METIYLTKIQKREYRPVIEVRCSQADIRKAGLDYDAETHGYCEFDYIETRYVFDELFGHAEKDPVDYLVLGQPHHAIRDAPYLIHTNYELPLMLDGLKPLAVFSDSEGSPILDQMKARFAPHVAAGHITMAEHLRSTEVLGKRFNLISLFYARPGEEWRIGLLRQLQDLIDKGGWHATCEEIEGLLLDYTRQQNDWWMKKRQASELK